MRCRCHLDSFISLIFVSGLLSGCGGFQPSVHREGIDPKPEVAAEAGLLKEGRSEAIEWGIYSRSEIGAEFSSLMEKSLTVPLGQVKPEKMPRAVARWVLENQEVGAALGAQAQ